MIPSKKMYNIIKRHFIAKKYYCFLCIRQTTLKKENNFNDTWVFIEINKNATVKMEVFNSFIAKEKKIIEYKNMLNATM
jgi:hypothetical protein